MIHAISVLSERITEHKTKLEKLLKMENEGCDIFIDKHYEMFIKHEIEAQNKCVQSLQDAIKVLLNHEKNNNDKSKNSQQPPIIP